MIYIGKYEELSPGRGYESMKSHMEGSSYKNQDIIIKYLKSGKVDMVSAAIPRDVFTGSTIPGGKLGMNDGEYMWWSTIAYYVEKYNLRLPEYFENHILKSTVH